MRTVAVTRTHPSSGLTTTAATIKTCQVHIATTTAATIEKLLLSSLATAAIVTDKRTSPFTTLCYLSQFLEAVALTPGPAAINNYNE
jgi:hypothetical protein